GFYASEPNLDFLRINAIREKTNLPIVMHGGSGLSSEEYRRAIKEGVKKINYYSYSAKAAMDATKKTIEINEPKLFDEIVVTAIKAIEEDYERVIKIFYNL